jgi:hypothetical protein
VHSKPLAIPASRQVESGLLSRPTEATPER